MTYIPKDMSGQLFKNDKGDNPSRPDYRGTALVNGAHVEIAAWIKEGQRGKFMSLSFKPKDMQASAPAKEAAGIDPYQDDSIPF